MCNEKKKKYSSKLKIILSFCIIVSFALVVAWNHFQDVNAYETIDNAGSSSFPKNGYYTYIKVKGPSGTSTLSIRVQQKTNTVYKNYTFDESSRPLVIETMSTGSSNPYKLSLVTTAVNTEKANTTNGQYSWVSIKVKYTVPAHEKYSSVTYDAPSSKAHHLTNTPAHKAAVQNDYVTTVGLSVYDTAVAPYRNPDTQKYYRYHDCAVTINLKKDSYTVNYKGNNGTISSAEASKTFACGSKLTFPKATRTGYSLTGWKDTANSSGTSYTTSSIVCGKGLTLYAQWKANQYKIHYNSNGGSGTMNDSTVTYNGSFTLSKNIFTKNGYQFLGWSKIKGGDTAAYEDQEKIKYQTASDITLYAVWGNGQYKISFQPNGADGGAKIIPVKAGVSYQLLANPFTRKGYIFLGWAKMQDALKADYANKQTVLNLVDVGKTIKLYAVWKKNDGSINRTNIIHDEGMFTGDIQIEGQNGTGYHSEHTDSKYAKIDQGDDPGYFTDRYR